MYGAGSVMNLNSQSLFYPVQPDNPSDSDRYYLSMDALAQRGRSEDFNNILRLLAPPPPITTYANPGEFKNIKVAVIGAGLAGLASAFELI